MLIEVLNEFESNIKVLRKFIDNVETIIDTDYNNLLQNVQHEMRIPLAFGMINVTEEEKIKYNKYFITESEKNYIEDASIDLKKESEEIDESIAREEIERLSKEINDLLNTYYTKNYRRIKNVNDNLNNTKKQKHVLYQSALISLVIALEYLISSVIKMRLLIYPKSIGKDSLKLSLEEISKLNSFEDAAEYIVDEEVLKIMMKGFLDWYEYIKKEMKITINYIEDNKSDIKEIFLRRNLYVHNAGIVNNIYLKELDKKEEGIALNQKIELTREYIEESLKRISIIGYDILLCAADSICKDEINEISNLVQEIGFDIMCEGRWDVAFNLFTRLQQLKNVSGEIKTISQINKCLCYKRLNQKDMLENELKDVDYSDKKSIYKLALYALKDMYDEFFDELQKCYSEQRTEDGITLEDLETWPLCGEIRERPEYETFKKEIYNKRKKIINKKKIDKTMNKKTKLDETA